MRKRFLSLLLLVAVIMTTVINQPILVNAQSTVVEKKKFDTNYYHTAAIKENGDLYVWGKNNAGQVGDGTQTNRTKPVYIMSDVKSVSVGSMYTLALKTDGTLWAWGLNSNGEIGDRVTIGYCTTKPFKLMDNVIDMSAGEDFSFIVTNDNKLYALGNNCYGQLGDNSMTDRTTPTKILDDVVFVSAGWHSAAIKKDGTMWVWGGARYSYPDSLVPVKKLDDVKYVSADWSNILAIKNDNTLWGWGLNDKGELCAGDDDYTTKPRKIMNDVKDVSTSVEHTFLVNTAGELFVCGTSSYGQLGLGVSSSSTTLIPTKIMDNISSVDVGFNTSFVCTKDGKLYACGNNTNGVLGDGTTTTRKSLVYIMDGLKKEKQSLDGKMIANYRSELINNASLEFDYSDKYFVDNDGYTYNHDLAKATLALELSSWTARGADDGSSSDRRSNISNLYRELGFVDNEGESTAKYYNYDDPLSDNSDKVAYSFATKKLYDGSTLVAVVVRGGGYGAEWRSNVHVGSGDMHYGFQLPALNVYADLLEYTKDVDKSNLKIWITGYSRGAAVANILSGRINEDNLIDRKNLYSYLFAVPKGVKVTENDANNSMHNNIYNIVLPYDVVPTLAFEKWGFGRYGQTLMVKNIQWNLSEYQQGGHEKYFREFTGRVYSLGPSVSRAAIKASNAICNFAGSQTEYATVLQGFFMDVVEWAMCRNDSLSEFINERYSVSDAVWLEMKNLAADYIMHSDSMIKFVGTDKIRLEDVICLMYLNGIDVYNDVYDNVYGKIGKAIKVINTSILNVGGTIEAHNPEYYIAWLYGYDDPRYIYDSETCKKITIACPVDVKVYDSAGNLVASVVNNEVVVDILPIDVIGESAEIYFYDGEDIDDYTIEIEAYDEGEVNYSVTEYENNGVETRKINYANIPVSIGTKLSGNVPKGQKLEAELYNLTSVTNGEETSVAFTDDLTGEDLQNLTVDVTIEGDGLANDIYFATKGELVTLDANPYYDASFVGWYDENDELISEEKEYSFILSESMKVTAKFTKCTAVVFTKVPQISNNVLNINSVVSSAKDVDAQYIMAIYSGDNKLLDTKIIPASLVGNTEKEVNETFNVSLLESTPAYAKLFLWSGFDDLIPLCNSTKADIQ